MIGKKNFKDKTVLLTGHTGFKGIWLSVWLSMLGAKVHGLSLYPNKDPKFELTKTSDAFCSEIEGDIRDLNCLTNTIESIQPDFVFHLAAQALVPHSFTSPLETWTTNALGTVNVLESLRRLEKKCVAILITSDKVYENKEWHWGYRENDQLGGLDPYSASKSAAELAISSYSKTFFSNQDKVRVAIARAGNVIGGGDWSENRIVPDCIRSWFSGSQVKLRSPESTRPWQHVLEPLSGYITLAMRLQSNKALHGEAFNFGPDENQNKTVLNLVKEMASHWPGSDYLIEAPAEGVVHETALLKLSVDKARTLLDWKPRWFFEQTVSETMAWYEIHRDGSNKSVVNLMKKQIENYNKV
jgi:CDP-glucose 4,6-dehydratase